MPPDFPRPLPPDLQRSSRFSRPNRGPERSVAETRVVNVVGSILLVGFAAALVIVTLAIAIKFWQAIL